MIGQTISHYKILEKLGEGGMGVVYKAQDTKLDRTIALKFLPQNITPTEAEKKRFIHEAQAASSLDHPNICTVYEIDETSDGQMFLAMAYYEGRTLKEKILASRPSVDEAVNIAIEIAQGLQAAHEKSIVHRDIKSANVMLTSKGQAKIMDFGLAKAAGRTQLTKAGATVGTIAYMSPEQALGEVVDHRSDIWSFGVVLFEMISGEIPFKSEYEQAVVYSILNEKPKPLTEFRPEVPAELVKIVSKCLAKQTADRYQTAEELLTDLRSFTGKPVPTLLKELSRAIESLKQRPVYWISSIGVLLVLSLLFIFSPWRAPSSERKSIAVLPFQNLSADGPHAYFAGGLHDELLTQLSKVAALTVISRTSVMGYAGKNIPLKQIASELGVGSVVEGSVQVVGGRLRVNVQLIDAATDAHLWAQHYDRTLEDAFAVQSDVAQQIVAAVGAALSGAERKRLTAAPTANAEAYQLYLQGREYLTRPGRLRQNWEIAQQLFERALGLDPDFALARGALSEEHGLMYLFRFDPSPTRAARQLKEAETALRLAPDLPKAHVAMGLAHYWGRSDYRRALEEFHVALEGLPNDAQLRAYIGFVHRRLGNWNKVLAAFEKAAQLDPRDADLFVEAGRTYQLLHRYAEAVRSYERALSLAPDHHEAAIGRGWTYLLLQGQLDTVRAVLSHLPKDAELGELGTRAAQNVQLLYLERQADSLLLALSVSHVRVFEGQRFVLPSSLYAAWAHQLRGDHAAARAAFDLARVLLDSALGELPDDWRVHAARGLALAGLGRRDEALREARWIQQSAIYREDAFDGPMAAEDQALILALVGDANAALDEIERLLDGPSFLSVHTLRLDPRWDPIREHPRFKALLAKYVGR